MRDRGRASGLLLSLVLFVSACSASDGISEGNRARDFTLEALDGGQVSLSDYDGKVVLVNLWATWCPPCRAELPILETAYQAHRDDGFVVLGVNVEEPRSTVQPFVDEMDLSFPVLLDEEGNVADEYRTIGLPMSILVNREGMIAVRHVGYLSDVTLDEYLNEHLPSP